MPDASRGQGLFVAGIARYWPGARDQIVVPRGTGGSPHSSVPSAASGLVDDCSTWNRMVVRLREIVVCTLHVERRTALPLCRRRNAAPGAGALRPVCSRRRRAVLPPDLGATTDSRRPPNWERRRRRRLSGRLAPSIRPIDLSPLATMTGRGGYVPRGGRRHPISLVGRRPAMSRAGCPMWNAAHPCSAWDAASRVPRGTHPLRARWLVVPDLQATACACWRALATLGPSGRSGGLHPVRRHVAACCGRELVRAHRWVTSPSGRMRLAVAVAMFHVERAPWMFHVEHQRPGRCIRTPCRRSVDRAHPAHGGSAGRCTYI